MARRRGPTLTQRVGLLEHYVERLQEQGERHARKIDELDRRLHAVEQELARVGARNSALDSEFPEAPLPPPPGAVVGESGFSAPPGSLAANPAAPNAPEARVGEWAPASAPAASAIAGRAPRAPEPQDSHFGLREAPQPHVSSAAPGSLSSPAVAAAEIPRAPESMVVSAAPGSPPAAAANSPNITPAPKPAPEIATLRQAPAQPLVAEQRAPAPPQSAAMAAHPGTPPAARKPGEIEIDPFAVADLHHEIAFHKRLTATGDRRWR